MMPFAVLVFSPSWHQVASCRFVSVLAAVLTLSANCTTRPDIVAYVRKDIAPGSAEAGAHGDDTSGNVAVDAAPLPSAELEAEAPSVVQPLELTGDLQAHDPSIVEEDGRYLLFYSGEGIPLKTSADLMTWHAAGQVFAESPSWIAELVPDAVTLWAPDIARVQGRYHLYYAASTFGSGRSCIGHASAEEPLTDSTAWQDHGPVICSDVDGADDDWDAIDPSQLTDAEGQRWLAFGSFGSGIKLIPLNEQGQREGSELHSLARRLEEPPAIQAPFLLHREPYHYLFVSFDACCRGVSSTNNIRVGRSLNLLGPYVDRDGLPMLEGGGTLLLEGNERWRGAGASTVLTTRGRDYAVYHSYDANAAGRATLRISEVAWDAEQWPVFGRP